MGTISYPKRLILSLHFGKQTELSVCYKFDIFSYTPFFSTSSILTFQIGPENSFITSKNRVEKPKAILSACKSIALTLQKHRF